jgi:hypothetical protein
MFITGATAMWALISPEAVSACPAMATSTPAAMVARGQDSTFRTVQFEIGGLRFPHRGLARRLLPAIGRCQIVSKAPEPPVRIGTVKAADVPVTVKHATVLPHGGRITVQRQCDQALSSRWLRSRSPRALSVSDFPRQPRP